MGVGRSMKLKHRHPALYIGLLAVALIGHAVLCYPASVARGYPPIHWFWTHFAIYPIFLTPIAAPAFEDFSDCPGFRNVILVMFAIAGAAIAAVPLTNIASGRPSIGHLAGYWGVWRYNFRPLVIYFGFASIIAIPFVMCVESIGRSGWDRIRKKPSSEKTESADPSTRHRR